MSAPFGYTQGAELEGIDITWPEPDGSLYDFSSGWTFTVRIGVPGQPALVQKTTDITGSATAPNLRISWDAGDLDAIPVGSYHLDVTARLAATSQDITRSWVLQIKPGVAAAAP